MQITCCYDDCSCSVTAIHSDRDLNRASVTSAVKFDIAQWARCFLIADSSNVTSNLVKKKAV